MSSRVSKQEGPDVMLPREAASAGGDPATGPVAPERSALRALGQRVAHQCGVPLDALFGADRRKAVVRAKATFIFVAMEHFGASAQTVGEMTRTGVSSVLKARVLGQRTANELGLADLIG